jgi:hypothetical protein
VDQLPLMLERIRKCQCCGMEVGGTALAYEENPFCKNCLKDRIQKASVGNNLLSWTERGDYLVATKLNPQKPQ